MLNNDASAGDDLLRNVKKPVLNWDAMAWMQKDYSRLRENITAKHPGLKRGFLGLGTFALILTSIVLYVNTHPFPVLKGFPVAGSIMIVAFFTFLKFVTGSWEKKPYLVLMAVFSLFSVASVLFGKHEGSSVFGAVMVALFCALATWVGFKSAVRLERWLSIAMSRRSIRRKVSAKDIRNTRIWGNVGDLEDATSKFGAQAVALGTAGEKFTAEFMEQLLRIPGTRIFHGLEFPGSFNGDVDHAVLNGNKLVFVDSKMWKAGNYRWGWDGVIEHEDNGVKTSINTNFHTAVLGYKKKLPEADIRSRILIHSAGGRPVVIDNSNAEKSKYAPTTEMITAQDFFTEIGDWFSEGTPGYVNKALVSALVSKLKP